MVRADDGQQRLPVARPVRRAGGDRPGLYGDESIVLTAIDDIGAHQRDVETIVVTHFHSDHAGAAQALADGTGARVCADAAAVLRGECCLAEVPAEQDATTSVPG